IVLPLPYPRIHLSLIASILISHSRVLPENVISLSNISTIIKPNHFSCNLYITTDKKKNVYINKYTYIEGYKKLGNMIKIINTIDIIIPVPLPANTTLAKLRIIKKKYFNFNLL